MNIRIHSTKFASVASVVVSLIVFSIKTSGYVYTHSLAILSDALESIINVVAAVVALIVIKFVSEPADTEHPYGHGKLEYFSSAFEGGLIFFAGLLITFESVIAFFKSEALHQLDMGIGIITVSAVLNLMLGKYLKYVGSKEKSEALSASGEHVMSDVWTTGGVIVGLTLVKLTGYTWLDPLCAMLVALNLLRSGFKIVFRSINGLIDAADENVLDNLTKCFNNQKLKGVIDIHHVKVIRAGKFHHVDAHIVVPEFWNIDRAHQETDEFEKKVVREYDFEGEIAFHLDPCKKSYCEICELENCSIRIHKYNMKKHFSAHELILGPNPPDKEEYQKHK